MLKTGIKKPGARLAKYRNMKFKAALSVEASWVFGISMLVIYSMLGLSFTLYHETYQYIREKEPYEMDAVKAFRLVQMGEDLLGNERSKTKD